MESFPIILAGTIAFAASGLCGRFLIPYLHKLKFGQTIKEIGPLWHKKKQGTPTMGGFMFIVGVVLAVVIAVLAWQGVTATVLSALQNVRLWGGLIMALAFAFVGFVDDYIKVVKKRNLGLKARYKIIMQVIISAAYLVMLYLAGDQGMRVALPFIGYINLSYFYYPLMMLYMIYYTNAVNLTDGIDGLCGSVTFVVAIGFMLIASLLRYPQMAILATALAGAMLGFLIWNLHPAKVFMGDTGSMFLGGLVLALSFGVGLPVFSVLTGFVYVFEALSVVIQMTYYHFTKKRIFKMSPIHHHFEMCGWKENKIVIVFTGITVVLTALTVFAATLL